MANTIERGEQFDTSLLTRGENLAARGQARWALMNEAYSTGNVRGAFNLGSDAAADKAAAVLHLGWERIQAKRKMSATAFDIYLRASRGRIEAGKLYYERQEASRVTSATAEEATA